MTVIVEYVDESVFLNLRIALQIMLTMAVSVASCERTSSKLNLMPSHRAGPSRCGAKARLRRGAPLSSAL